MSAIKELQTLADRLNFLTSARGAIAQANAKPDEWMRRADDVLIRHRDPYRHIPAEDVEVLTQIKSEFKERFVKKGADERAQALKSIAAEIETIRAVLPSIAARAAIEAGIVAREAAKEGGA